MLLVIVTLLSLALPCSAVAFPEGKQPIVNVSTTDPMNGIALLETTYPTATHHMHSQGSLPFSGNAAYSMLYLNAMVFDCHLIITAILAANRAMQGVVAYVVNIDDVGATVKNPGIQIQH